MLSPPAIRCWYATAGMTQELHPFANGFAVAPQVTAASQVRSGNTMPTVTTLAVGYAIVMANMDVDRALSTLNPNDEDGWIVFTDPGNDLALVYPAMVQDALDSMPNTVAMGDTNKVTIAWPQTTRDVAHHAAPGLTGATRTFTLNANGIAVADRAAAPSGVTGSGPGDPVITATRQALG